jgi:hypothetical protein
MGCGCGGGAAGAKSYEVTKPDGTVVPVRSASEARRVIARDGGKAESIAADGTRRPL